MHNHTEKTAYLKHRLGALLSDDELRAQIEVKVWDTPGAMLAMFAGDEGYRIYVPPWEFKNLRLLDLGLAHEIGHVARGCTFGVLFHLSSALPNGRLRGTLFQLAVWWDQLTGGMARRESDADCWAIDAAVRLGYRPAEYEAVIEGVLRTTRRIRKRRYRWLKLFANRHRARIVRRYIRRQTPREGSAG